MAFKFANRVKMATSTTGTGTITLGSTVAGFQNFAAAGLVDGDTTRYLVVDGNAWEIGLGTYAASGPTLTRTTVIESSNSDAEINLSGSAIVMGILAAADLQLLGPADSPTFAGLTIGGVATTVIREVLAADRTYYVRTDGNDSNTGLVDSSGGAKLTLAGAFAALNGIDFNGHTVTIQMGDGTYNGGGVAVPKCVGQSDASKLLLRGDPSAPGDVVLNNDAAAYNGYIVVPQGSAISPTGLRFTGGVDHAYGIGCTGGVVEFGAGLEFGGFTGLNSTHIACQGNGYINKNNQDYVVNGAAGRHIFAETGLISSFGGTVTVSGSPAFSSRFAYAARLGCIIDQTTYSGATTGQRYLAEKNGVIETYGGGASKFPGDSAGSTATGGQYS